MKKIFLFVSLFFLLFTSALVKTSDASSWFFIKTPVSSFTPASLSGLKLWVKADQITASDGDAVSSWSDQSGNGYNLTAVNNATYKTNIQNSLPIVRFDGTNDAMDTATNLVNIISLSAHSIWVVIIPRAFNSNFTASYYPNEAIMTEKAGGNWGAYLLSSGPYFGFESYGGAGNRGTLTVATNTAYIYHVRHSGGNMYMSVNNGSETSFTSSDFYGGTNVLRIGCNYDTPAASTCAQIDIGEIVISNVAESAGNLTDMQTYLNNKWAAY